jgi:hypothetical protein
LSSLPTTPVTTPPTYATPIKATMAVARTTRRSDAGESSESTV